MRKIVEAANVNVVSVQRFDKPEKNEVLLRLWSFGLFSIAVVAAVSLAALRIAAILGLF